MAAKKPKKTAAKKRPSPDANRQLKKPVGRLARLTGRGNSSSYPSISPAPVIFAASVRYLWRYKKLFLGISAVYLTLTLVLVRGFGLTGDVTVAKEVIQELISGSAGQIAGSLTAFGVLLSSSGPATGVAVAYQSILLIVTSLAVIWALRQTQAGQSVTIKDSFYYSTYPLVPFLLVVLMVSVQLLPLLAANFLYGATFGSSVVTGGLEALAWIVVLFGLVLWSLYMITTSLFAMYIVTLPDMTPLKALRSARVLVAPRRWTVMRKLLFLPLAFGVVAAAVLIPIIILFTPLAEVLFILLSALSVPAYHSYMYSLYRELLNE